MHRPAGAPQPMPQAPDVPMRPPRDGAGFDGDTIVDEWGRQSFPVSDPPANCLRCEARDSGPFLPGVGNLR